MTFMSTLTGEKKLVEAIISFYKSGEINIKLINNLETHKKVGILELFCNSYVDILYNIGKSPVCDRIIMSFDSISKAYSKNEKININLTEIARSIGKLLELGFDVLERFRIQDFRIVADKNGKPSAKHRISLVENRHQRRYIKTYYGAWMAKLYVPLTLFAFFSYINDLILENDDDLQSSLMAYIYFLHKTEWIKQYGTLSGMLALSNFTESYFKKWPT